MVGTRSGTAPGASSTACGRGKSSHHFKADAAAKASKEVAAREKELIAVFKEKGLTIVEVDTNDFRDTVMKNIPFESFGYRKADWDRIQAIKSDGM